VFEYNLSENGSKCYTLYGQRHKLTPFRTHVYADLQPYVCFYNDCPQKETTFTDRSTFSHHLDLDHRLGPEWQSLSCPLCLQCLGPGRSAISGHIAKHMEEISLDALPRPGDSDISSVIDSEVDSEIVSEPASKRNPNFIPEVNTDVHSGVKPEDSPGQHSETDSLRSSVLPAGNDMGISSPRKEDSKIREVPHDFLAQLSKDDHLELTNTPSALCTHLYKYIPTGH
jgi:hypothetical protein